MLGMLWGLTNKAFSRSKPRPLHEGRWMIGSEPDRCSHPTIDGGRCLNQAAANFTDRRDQVWPICMTHLVSRAEHLSFW